MTTVLTQPEPVSTAQKSASCRPCWFWAGWEPDRYYQRIGGRTTPFFGNGDWIADWRAHLESPQTLRGVKEAGGSVLITRFYKGFGPAVERRDWDSLKHFVDLAHEEGLQVRGYLQGRSLFGEFLFHEYPEARDWIARGYDGKRQHWGGAYNRFAPCLTSRGYLQMMEAVLEEGLLEVGLDGIHMDNNYYGHCYCERCKGGFRDWLTARGDLEALTGIVDAGFIEPPPLVMEADLQPDPLAALWIEFGVEARLGFMQALRKKQREVKPEASMSGNPAFLRSYASRLTHGLDPAQEHLAFDSVCIENGNRPRFSNGVLFTQADKHLMGEAGGLKTWVTSWAPSASGTGYGVPEEAQGIWAGLAEEFSFRNASLGNTWALRPAGEGSLLMNEAKAAGWAVFKEAMQFFQRLEAMLGDEPRSQNAELVLYIDTATLALSSTGDSHLVQAVIERLLMKRLTFKIVFAQQALPPEVRTVVVPGQRCLKSGEMERLARWAGGKGRELWLLGPCGGYDDRVVPRSASRREALWQGANVRQFALPLQGWLRREGSGQQYFRGVSPTFNEEGAAALEPVLAELAARQSIEIDAPAGLLANVERQGSARYLLHLRDLRDDASSVEAGEVCLTLRGNFGAIAGFSLNWGEGRDFKAKGSEVEGSPVATLPLPEFSNYAALLLEFANPPYPSTDQELPLTIKKA